MERLVSIRHVLWHVKTSALAPIHGTVVRAANASPRSSTLGNKVHNRVKVGTHNHIEEVTRGQESCIGKANEDMFDSKLIVIGWLFISERIEQ